MHRSVCFSFCCRWKRNPVETQLVREAQMVMRLLDNRSSTIRFIVTQRATAGEVQELLFSLTFFFGTSAVQMTPGPLQPPIRRCITLIGLFGTHPAAVYNGAKHHSNRGDAIHAFALYQHHISTLVFLQSNRFSVIKRMLFYYRPIYLSANSFIYLCVPCYCHVCLSLLRCVWVRMRYSIHCCSSICFHHPKDLSPGMSLAAVKSIRGGSNLALGIADARGVC